MATTSRTHDPKVVEGRPHRRRWWRRIAFFLVGLLFLGTTFDLLTGSVTRAVLWRIYTPPTLTNERLATFAEFIRIVQKHPGFHLVSLDTWGELGGDFRFDLNTLGSIPQEPVPASSASEMPEGEEPSLRMGRRFSPTELAALKDISGRLRGIQCTLAVMVQRGGGPRFYVFSRYPDSGSGQFLSPNAVYVVDAPDPNDVSAVRQATGHRDLEHIKGGWYASRSLGASRVRPRGLQIRKSIFDHALDVPSDFDTEQGSMGQAGVNGHDKTGNLSSRARRFGVGEIPQAEVECGENTGGLYPN